MTRVYSREEVRTIPIRARRALGGLHHGEAKSRTRGLQGLEFSDFRQYEPGDDVARIDWNVTARLGKPWVRMYLEERGHPVLLMVDVSASTDCGRSEFAPRTVIAEVAARLASAAIWNGCQTGLLLFADRVTKYVPGASGIRQLSDMVRELKAAAEKDSETGETDVAGALDFARTRSQRRCLVFLISDFVCGDFAASLRSCAARHEIVAIAAEDTAVMPDCGLLNLRDPETGFFRQLDTGSPEVRRAYGDAVRERLERNADSFRKAGVDYLPLDPAQNYVGALTAFLRRRVG